MHPPDRQIQVVGSQPVQALDADRKLERDATSRCLLSQLAKERWRNQSADKIVSGKPKRARRRSWIELRRHLEGILRNPKDRLYLRQQRVGWVEPSAKPITSSTTARP
jgi:hypothetical protein